MGGMMIVIRFSFGIKKFHLVLIKKSNIVVDKIFRNAWVQEV